MKFLLEDYGESNQLDDFVNLSNGKFKTYYRVRQKAKTLTSNRYFAYEDAAKDYYSKLLEDIKNDLEHNDGTDISLTEVTLNPIEDEIESYFADYTQWQEDQEENN